MNWIDLEINLLYFLSYFLLVIVVANNYQLMLPFLVFLFASEKLDWNRWSVQYQSCWPKESHLGDNQSYIPFLNKIWGRDIMCCSVFKVSFKERENQSKNYLNKREQGLEGYYRCHNIYNVVETGKWYYFYNYIPRGITPDSLPNWPHQPQNYPSVSSVWGQKSTMEPFNSSEVFWERLLAFSCGYQSHVASFFIR